MRRIVFMVVLVVAVIGGGSYGWHWWNVGRFFETTDNAYVHSDISVISPRIQGYVRDVVVQENQQVAPGDVLVVIEATDFAAKVAEARAAVENAKAAIGSIDSKVVLQQSMVREAAAGIASAEAELNRAQKDVERYRPLVSSDYVSHQKFETADADWRKADAALAKAKAALGAEQSQLGVLAASRVEAVTKVEETQATLAVVQNDLDNTVIRSPIAGVVGNRGVQAGQYVKAGSTLLSIVPLPNVYVVANFKETQLARMRLGQPVEITVDAYPGQTLSGQVESFAPASGSQFSLLPPENATGNFTKIVQRVPVRIAVPTNSALAGLIRPGLSVTASVDTRGAGPSTAQPTVVGSVFGAIQARTQSSSAK